MTLNLLACLMTEPGHRAVGIREYLLGEGLGTSDLTLLPRHECRVLQLILEPAKDVTRHRFDDRFDLTWCCPPKCCQR